jgi:hypothetical protein
MNKTVSRRNFVKAGAAGASLLGMTQLFGISTALAQNDDDDTQTIINLAATAELFATTHYLAGINGAEAMGLGEVQVNYLKTGFLAEQDHLELLQSLGATPLFTEFYVPETLFSDVDLFSQITELAETTFVSAYLAATRIFAAAGATPFAVTTAQIAAVEAEHRALVRQIGGRIANNIPYAQFQFNNVSDAVPVLMPFLDGSGEGFVGPVQPPTADQIAAIRAEADSLGYVSVVPFAAMPAPTDTAAMGDCTVTPAGNQAVNLRSGPGTSFAVAGNLHPGETAAVDGQAPGATGAIWYHLTSGSWVRSDIVTATGSCASLPMMSVDMADPAATEDASG